MMKKAVLILIIIISVIAFAFGNSYTQNIRGTVTDEITGIPLPGANIILLNTEPAIGATTDLNGNFEILNIEVGRVSLEFRFIGYKPKTYSNLLLTTGKELIIHVKLEESTVEVDEIIVSARRSKDEVQNDMAMISARTFSVEETERFAGSLGDPARMVANYAGVMTQNDSRNDIIIRGNSPMGVVWRLEGIEIPNPNHFGALGTTGGPVSMINNNLLTNSDFLTGAFPAEYGNATSGAFDLYMRSGNNQTHEFVGQVGFNGFEAGAEGPMWTTSRQVKASYLINYRYSTLDVMHKIGLDFGTGQAIPEYQDLTFVVDIPGTRAGRFKIFGLYGKSYIEMGRDQADSIESSYNSRGTATNFGSGLYALGISNTFFLNERFQWKTSVSLQSTDVITEYDSVKASDKSIMPYYRSNQLESKFSFASQIRCKLDSRNKFSIGLNYDMFFIDYIDSIFNHDNNKFINLADIRKDLSLTRAYGQWQHNFNDDLASYAGFHLQYFALNKEISAEPRLAIRWQVSQKNYFNLGFGIHSQLQPKTIYFLQTYDSVRDSYHLTNKDVKFTRSNHYVLGYNRKINSFFRLCIETYVQNLYRVPVNREMPEFSMLNFGADFAMPHVDSLLNKGTGTNYGIEFTLEKFLNRGYYYLITASLFDSRYRGYDKLLRNTAWNGNYVLNVLGGYELKAGKNSLITMDIKTVWAGGKRYVPVDFTHSVTSGDEERDWAHAYEKKYDDYFRTDIRFGLKINGKKISQEWALDLQNITGFKSIFMEGYDPQEKEIYYVYQQGFMPMMLYRIQF